MTRRFCIVEGAHVDSFTGEEIGTFAGRIFCIGAVEADCVQFVVEHMRTGALITVDHSFISLVNDDQHPAYKRVARNEAARARRTKR